MELVFTGSLILALSVLMSNAEPRVPQPLKIAAGIEIPLGEQSPLVLALVAVIQGQAEEIQSLRDEIQRMKGTTVRPKIAPSRLREELKEFGIDISAGQISNILLQGHEAFRGERDKLLPAAKEICAYLRDRLTKANDIPPLTDLMRARVKQNPPPVAVRLTC